jgi:hypothetical protein
MSERTIGPESQAMLNMLPPYEADDENVIAVMVAEGNEIARLEAAGQAFQAKVIPAQADDEYSTLSIWEAMLGLPVDPPTATVADRREFVLARLRARSVATGEEWFDRMSDVLGSGWSYEEGPADYSITLRVPFIPGGSRIDVNGFARTITPAHLDILFQFEEGFVMGVSQFGDEI